MVSAGLNLAAGFFGGAVFQALTLGILSFPVSATASDIPRIGSARERNAQILARIRTAVVTEEVSTSIKCEATFEQQRADQKRSIELTSGMLAQHAERNGAGQPGRDEIETSRRHQLEFLENSLQQQRLNSATTVRRTTTFDIERNRMRRDDLDPRDLDELVKQNGMGKWDRTSLDKTGSTISDGDKPEIKLHTPLVGKLATLMSYRTLNTELERFKLGVAPSWVFGSEYSLEYRDSGDRSEVTLISRAVSTGARTYEIEFSRQHGYAMSSCKRFAGDAVVEEFVASDFRAIEGVFIPFRTRTAYHEPVADFCIIERRVQDATINTPIPDADAFFAAPKDHRVQDLTGRNPQ